MSSAYYGVPKGFKEGMCRSQEIFRGLRGYLKVLGAFNRTQVLFKEYQGRFRWSMDVSEGYTGFQVASRALHTIQTFLKFPSKYP